jgi:hypothetical protein
LAKVILIKNPKTYPVQNRGSTRIYQRWEVNTQKGHDALLAYLSDFPLKGPRRFQVQRFRLIRRRQILRGSRITSPRMAKRLARLVNSFVNRRNNNNQAQS